MPANQNDQAAPEFLHRLAEAQQLYQAGMISKKAVKRAKRKVGGMFTLFMQQFPDEAAKLAFWDTIMRMLDKQLRDSGLSITHEHVPTSLLVGWLGGDCSLRSMRFGNKDVLAFAEFIDDTWPQLFQLEKLLPSAPADPIKPDTVSKPDEASFSTQYVTVAAPDPGPIGNIQRDGQIVRGNIVNGWW